MTSPAGAPSPEATSPSSLGEQALAHIAMFARADATQVLAALAGCSILHLAPGAVLLRAGEPNHDVYIPLSGSVLVHLNNSDSPESTVPVKLGECVGELSAIDGKPASATVQAATHADVLKVPQAVFWHRLMAVHGVAASFMVVLTERVRRTTHQALQAQSEKLELQHLRKELDVASQLQTSMLPLQRPLFPERRDIEVCGIMEPASKVGGDLFDAFFVRERLLFFCIGDVSGHGIASALFMARTIGLLRILAMNTQAPDQLLQELNRRLCAHNETHLFVTLFCGFLDVESGRLDYSNGGHCAPLLCEGGAVRELPIPRGPLVGAFDGATYLPMSCQLAVDDTLYCYTDGVTEAQDAHAAEFTEQRCQAVLTALGPTVALQDALDTLRRTVAAFTGTPVLEDDFTMLAVRRRAPLQAPSPQDGHPTS